MKGDSVPEFVLSRVCPLGLLHSKVSVSCHLPYPLPERHVMAPGEALVLHPWVLSDRLALCAHRCGQVQQ